MTVMTDAQRILILFSEYSVVCMGNEARGRLFVEALCRMARGAPWHPVAGRVRAVERGLSPLGRRVRPGHLAPPRSCLIADRAYDADALRA